MNGTSSATPVTAGVIALMLEANPALTWRDVKHILASTARHIRLDASGGQCRLTAATTLAEPSGRPTMPDFSSILVRFRMVDASAA